MDKVIKLLPFKYIHVLDLNKNVTLLEVGPQTYTCLADKKIVLGPENMLIIPPNHYCVVENPVVRGKNGEVVVDEYGQAQLRYTELEVRLAGDPFPLYPGEQIRKNISPLQLLSFNQALHLRAIRDVLIEDPQQLISSPSFSHDDCNESSLNHIQDKNNNDHQKKNKNIIMNKEGKEWKKAGEEWYFVGPGHYIPNVSVEVVRVVEQVIIEQGTALKLKANRDLLDNFYHQPRKNGDIWLLKEPGPYLKHVYEEILTVEVPHLISEGTALHLRALRDFTDDYNITRHFGEEYLINNHLATSHLLNVNEELVARQDAIILNNRQYIVIENPYSQKQQRFLLGKRKILRGPRILFLKPPYERNLGVAEATVLSSSEMIALTAKEPFYDSHRYSSSNVDDDDEDDEVDEKKLKAKHKKLTLRKPGDTWYFYGPGEYWPILEASGRKQNAILIMEGLNLRLFHLSTVVNVLLLLFLCYLPFWSGWISFS